jgi:hypothetical protein
VRCNNEPKQGKEKQPVLCSIISLVLVCFYPCLFQYARNIPEARLPDALLFFGIFLAIGAVGYLIVLGITRRAGAAGLLSSLGMLAFTNIGLVTGALQNYFSWFRARYLTAAVLLLGILLLVLLMKKRWRCGVPCLLLILAFGAMSIASVGMAVPKLLEQQRENQSRSQQQTETADAQDSLLDAALSGEQKDLSNVYYYLYDEFAGPECLEYFYEFDHSDFYRQLEQRGFSCSMDSYNVESTVTVQLIPDLYHLGYGVPEYFESGDGAEPRLYQLFQRMGYQINLINHMDFLDTDGARVLTTRQHEDSICVYLYQNSLLPGIPYLSGLIERLPQLQTEMGYTEMLQEALGLMDTAWQYSQNGPTLTLGYVQCPHTYFLYDADGNPIPAEHGNDWDDPKYYLGYLQYASQRILAAVDEIQAHDPTAIIILQSDHGARTVYREAIHGNLEQVNQEDVHHQQNVLNCVYLPGQTVDIQGKSGINTLRTVLDQAYHMDLPMVEPEHDESKEFDP